MLLSIGYVVVGRRSSLRPPRVVIIDVDGEVGPDRAGGNVDAIICEPYAD